jgi:hypothetical protein
MVLWERAFGLDGHSEKCLRRVVSHSRDFPADLERVVNREQLFSLEQ